MGKLRGFVLAGAAMTFIMPFLAGAGTVRAADIVAPEATSYTYFGVEGGYVNLDGADVQAFLYRTDLEQEDPFRERSLNLSDGYYGRVEVGHAWDDTGI